MLLPSSKRSWIAGVVLVCLLLTSGCIGQFGTDGDAARSREAVDVELTATEIIERTTTASGYRTVRGRQVIHSTDGVVRVWERGPNRSRFEIGERTASDEFDVGGVSVIRGSTIRQNGMIEDEIWIAPRARELQHNPYGSEALSGKLLRDSKARVQGTDTVLGRSTYVLEVIWELNAGVGYEFQTTLWIDQHRFYPLKYTTKGLDTGSNTTVVFEEIEFDVPIDSERFTLAPEANETIMGGHEGRFESIAAADFATPTTLHAPTVPDAYDLAWTRMNTTEDGSTVRAKYHTDAGDRLSITWSPDRRIPTGTTLEVDESEATIVDGRRWTTVYQSCGDRTLVVGGSTASPGTLVDVAASVDCRAEPSA